MGKDAMRIFELLLKFFGKKNVKAILYANFFDGVYMNLEIGADNKFTIQLKFEWRDFIHSHND